MAFRTTALALILGAVLLAMVPLAFVLARRGGRYRALPGWVGFWGFFAPLLVLLSRAPRWMSLPLLGVLMFVALREYHFLAHHRQRDRWAVLATYVAIPVALWPAYAASSILFLIVAPLLLFVFLPVLLALGRPQSGLLESAGRVLMGAIAFVFCAAHLGLMAESFEPGQIELYGVLTLASELPQRLAGRMRSADEGLPRAILGVVAGMALAAGLGAALGPLGGLPGLPGVVAGALVAAGNAAGMFLADAVAQDLKLGTAATRIGRGAFLDRSFPAVYAAPAFFHYVAYVTAFR